MADDPGNQAGWPRRDALKAIAALAAAPLAADPLAAQTGAAPQNPAGERGAVAAGKRGQSFDDGWRFLRGDAPGADVAGFNDASWRTIDLPHDWSVEDLPPRRADGNGEGAVWGTDVVPTRVGPFDTELSAGRRDTGWFVGGTGWYRKRFSAAAVPPDGQVEIVFDGVYMNSDVWLNGTLLGNRPYGYTAFAYDLTPHIRRTGENVLAVRVRNEGRNSRWYSGSGIYRHVWLNTTGSVRVPLWGVFVTTPEVSKDKAAVKVGVQIENRASAAKDVTVRIRLFDSKHASAGTRDVAHSLAGGASASVEHVFIVAAPQLWSVDAPQLYRADVELLEGGRTADAIATPFGIRRLEIDAERGLRINGEPVKLRGGCLHHDNGLLGACAIDRAEERRVELMKAHGFNAIRTSHNPPSTGFLNACDHLGMLVMDEAFDQWERQKNAQDYHLSFADWWQRDVGAMVLRDRNHPSVIMWSIGNEIPERAESRGREIAKALVGHIKSLDPTRPVTAAINGARGGSEGLDPAFQFLDVGGYNYLEQAYDADHARHPQRIIVGTESFPGRAFESWAPVERHAHVIGDFVWTGMDHLGESSIGNAQLNAPVRPGPGTPPPATQTSPTPTVPGAPAVTAFTWPAAGSNISLPFPWFNCYCGDIDLIGEPKAQWYYRRVLWELSPVEMLVQRPVPEGRREVISWWGWSDELRSWTWPGHDGTRLKVRVYTSADEVRLLLNGREIAAKPVPQDAQLKVEFDVPYSAGELKAVARSNGRPVGECALTTAGAPAGLRLRADRAALRASRNDLAYVTVEVVDRSGHLVPDAVVPVAFEVSGAGELAAAGSANPKDVFSFRRSSPKTFHGRALAIVRPHGAVGLVTVRAQASHLTPGSLTLRVR
jgi:beta-galactosidase